MYVKIQMTYGVAEITTPDDLSPRDLRKLETLVSLARLCEESTHARRTGSPSESKAPPAEAPSDV